MRCVSSMRSRNQQLACHQYPARVRLPPPPPSLLNNDAAPFPPASTHFRTLFRERCHGSAQAAWPQHFQQILRCAGNAGREGVTDCRRLKRIVDGKLISFRLRCEPISASVGTRRKLFSGPQLNKDLGLIYCHSGDYKNGRTELLEAQKMSPADEDIKKSLNLLQQQARPNEWRFFINAISAEYAVSHSLPQALLRATGIYPGDWSSQFPLGVTIWIPPTNDTFHIQFRRGCVLARRSLENISLYHGCRCPAAHRKRTFVPCAG
jgi:hypothetical protein